MRNLLEYRTNHQVGEFGYDQTKGEGLPVVDLGLFLSSFEDVTPSDKERLDLRDDTRGANKAFQRGQPGAT
jgi:hypothetical protein